MIKVCCIHFSDPYLLIYCAQKIKPHLNFKKVLCFSLKMVLIHNVMKIPNFYVRIDKSFLHSANPPVLLISLDGFWNGYFERNVTEFISSLSIYCYICITISTVFT